jgi:hypothetical protein
VADKPGILARPEFWEILCASALLAWRIRVRPLSTLWSDWLSILCVFWIATALGRRWKHWPVVTAAVMAGLLALYASRQVPLTLGALGITP